METHIIEPAFNFPYQLQFKHNGRRGKMRHLFTDYGVTSMIDVDQDGKVFSQIKKGDNVSKYAAVHPVLPLSETAEDVKLEGSDRIIGYTKEKNKKLKKFIQRVQKIYSHGKRFGKTDVLKDILSHSRQLISKFETDQRDINKAVTDDFIDGMAPAWFTEMFHEYTEIEGCIPKYHNYKYEGGCIDTISIDDTHCYIVSAAGKKFNRLRSTLVSKKSEGLLQSFISEELKLSKTIYGVKNRMVQGRHYTSVLTKDECYLYKFTPDSQEGKLTTVHEPLNQSFQSLDISPYIPGECVLVDDEGHCCLWAASCLDTISAQGEPRFQVADNWRHVQYGSHPRQVIYADQTAVQIFDLRVKNADGVDLFSLPSEMLFNRERIRTCSQHLASPFYHLVATDYKLLMMDERFQKYPVLKWEHMLTSPPQYMSNICEADDNFVYIGSQYPADVHAFRFSARNGQPPLCVGRPHRASRIVDLSKWPHFLDNCPNLDLLHNRLNTSLAGIAAVPWQQGHVIFQMDAHGEIFHQVFSRNCQSSADVTFSAGMGSVGLKPNSCAVERAQCWIESWGDMMKRQLASDMKMKEIRKDMLGIFFNSNPHESCCVCNPDLLHVPDNGAVSKENGFCCTCLINIKESNNFVKSIQKDGVIPFTSELRPYNLEEVTDVSTDSALSKLLMKNWFGAEDSNTMEEIMTNWDNEVIESRSVKKGCRKQHVPDMSEESVMDRIRSRSIHQAGSSNSYTHSVSDMENMEPCTDDPNGGQRLRKSESQKSRKRRHSAENLHVSKPKSHKKDSERKGSKMGSSLAETLSIGNETVVPGTSVSDVSETFPILDKNDAGTSIFGIPSLVEQKKHKSSKAHKQKIRHASQDKILLAGSETQSVENNSISLFSDHASKDHDTSAQFKIPSPLGKRKSSKREQKASPGSCVTVETASDISVNTGSNNLFDSPENIGDSQSSEFSAASCTGLFKSQVSQKGVVKQLFSDVKSDKKEVNSTMNSPGKFQCGISPRKLSQRKHLSGF